MVAMWWRLAAFVLVWLAGLGQVGSASGPRSSRAKEAGSVATQRAEPATDAGAAVPTARLPAAVAAEIGRVDATFRWILTTQPIGQWRFDSVRAAYQAILKRSGADPAVEEALRDRLARVTRHEQAAQAARTIETILARCRRRDAELAQVPRRLAAAERAHARAYSAIGLIQPSSRMIEGRKLHALIGSNGSTLAYLDIPLGLDLESLRSRQVGVRGVTHYNPDLGTRLITVRDLEAIESRR